MKDAFARKLVELEEQRKRAAVAAAGFPAFMRAGGEDEIRSVSCHTAYGPENVQDVYDEDAYRKWIAYHKDMTARFPERLSKDPA